MPFLPMSWFSFWVYLLLWIILTNSLNYLLLWADKGFSQSNHPRQIRVRTNLVVLIGLLGGGLGAWVSCQHNQHFTKNKALMQCFLAEGVLYILIWWMLFHLNTWGLQIQRLGHIPN